MKTSRRFRQWTVALALFGLAIPQVSLVCGQDQATAPASIRVIDVSLSEGGVLKGQVVSASGTALADQTVAVMKGNETLATTRTNAHGEFAVDGLRGGTYLVTTTGATNAIRAWAPRTAPPSAVAGLLMVPDSATARAQFGGGNLGLGALLLGGVIGIVTFVAVEHNDAS